MPSSKLGPFYLAPDVMPAHALTFFYAAFIGITLYNYINFIQPYILTEHLQIPEDQQGAITGNLVFLSELMLLFACGVARLLVDTVDRRAVFAIGFLILGAGFAIYGHVESE
ncbi:hypothetical protein A3709_12845 [Halioglobus sp. HI00S01]|uniref:hypothetical protein n=1 Tax=Halioglobus sp. HI00S01 TaxID=1822214 RepID=UPI0007C30FCA|nr:hypothetical protein [Halioglobus sp. HI00S01]KZX60180.1 hypothetical protein A3709_12845 [Halioglobus sp. HI00S01]